MTAPAPSAPSPFEEQLAAGLRQRAASIAPPPDARDRIDARVAHRTHARRVRRAGLAAVVAIALLAGAIAVAQSGHDDASVVTTPGVPAVHIPQLGLPPDVGRTRIMSYVPGRSVSSLLLRGVGDGSSGSGTTPSSGQNGSSPTGIATIVPMIGAQLQIVVTDSMLDEFATSVGRTSPLGAVEINDQPGAAFTVDPGTDHAREVVVWQAAPQVVASLSVAGTDVTEPLGANLILLAAGLVELDDTTWWSLLNPDPNATWLGTDVPGSVGEISAYAPHETGGNALQILDLPGYPAATFQLAQDNGGKVSLDAVDDPDHVDVRGTSGLITDAPGYFTTAFGFTKSLEWVEGGATYRLDFTDAATPAEAMKVAEQLTILSADRWHDLLFPSTLRTDLVPMPVIRPILGPSDSQPSASTVLSVPNDPSTSPTTGG